MSSPNIYFSENPSNIYPDLPTGEIALFCGIFENGPHKPIYISNVNEFEKLYGAPVGYYENDWFQVYNFLQYCSGIIIQRVQGNNSTLSSNMGSIDINFLNRMVTTRNNIIDNLDKLSNKLESFDILDDNSIDGYSDVEDTYKTIKTTDGLFVCSKYCGSIYNDYKVNVILYKDATEDQKSEYKLLKNQNVIVVENNGVIIELHKFFKEFIPEESNFYWYIDINELKTLTHTLTGGLSQFPTHGDFIEAYEEFENIELYDIDIIIGNEMCNELSIELAEKRKDCLNFIGLPSKILNILGIPINNRLNVFLDNYKNAYYLSNENFENKDINITYELIEQYINSLPKSTYTFFVPYYKKQLNHITNKNMDINISGDIAGLFSINSLKKPWAASAGLERGSIKNTLNVLPILKNKFDDELHYMGANIIKNKILMSQRTFVDDDGNTSYSRANIRNIGNKIKKYTSKLVNNKVFDFNDYYNIEELKSQINKLLEKIMFSGGIQDYFIEVDGDLFDNKMILNVYFKPYYSVETILFKMNIME